MKHKELEIVRVNEEYGGNQYHFRHPIMNRGGCSTVAACHAAAILAIKDPTRSDLYPYDRLQISQTEFTKFADRMYRYIAPGFRGMAETRLFEKGFEKYAIAHEVEIRFESLQGDASFEEAREMIHRMIDNDISVQYLLLRHTNPLFDEIEWHWFTVTGYQGDDIIYSTWGERRTANLKLLWDTGHQEKGGLIAVL